MTTEVLLKNILCTGCLACYDSCCTRAIDVIKDKYGFQFPAIDSSKCIQCNKCIKTCPCRNEIERKNPLRSYAAYCKEENIYKYSASGGIFAAISHAFIERGGVVYGAAYDPEIGFVRHIAVEHEENIRKLQGSKYVQSDTTNVYKSIKNALKQGKRVLFSGTPCQVAAVYSSIDKNYLENLFTIEVICHGVSNNTMLNKSISSYCTNSYPKDIRFRNKTKYEKSEFSLRLYYGDGSVKTVDSSRDLYYRLYVDGKNYRESCYECNYATTRRIADITLGDCSTYKDYVCLTAEKALSSVIINSDKGRDLWGMIINLVDYVEQNMEKEFRSNEQLSHPTKKPKDLEYIYKDYFELSIKQLKQKYVSLNLKDEFKRIVKKVIPLKVRISIRNMLK